MKVELLIIGDEILEGLVEDTNARYLCSVLAEKGLRPHRVTFLGDDAEAITRGIRAALGDSDLIIVTGGLGPTPDDKTREAAAQALGLRLVLNRDYLRTIKEKFEAHGIPFTQAEEAFALLPEGARVLPNPKGLCGFRIEHKKKELFFLPGVPEEVKAIVETSLLPFLQERAPRKGRAERILRVFGPTEGQVREALRGLKGPFQLAYLPRFPELHLKVRVEGVEDPEGTLEEVVGEISRRLGIAVYGFDQDTMEGVVGRLLTERHLTLATAESCTGGLIGHRITEVPGSSLYYLGGLVSYSNESKVRDLGVPPEVLEAHGAVSAPCARAMAEGVRRRFGSDLGIATTGIAGPTGGTPEKPVGTVFMALSTEEGTEAKGFRFFGDRSQVKLMTSQVALDWLRRWLLRSTSP